MDAPPPKGQQGKVKVKESESEGKQNARRSSSERRENQDQPRTAARKSMATPPGSAKQAVMKPRGFSLSLLDKADQCEQMLNRHLLNGHLNHMKLDSFMILMGILESTVIH